MNNIYNNTPPPQLSEDKFLPELRQFIEVLRKDILKVTIEQLVVMMDWSNEKYYSKIMNGYMCNGIKKYSEPSVNYIFRGLNYAFANHEEFRINKNKIEEAFYKYIWKIK